MHVNQSLGVPSPRTVAGPWRWALFSYGFRPFFLAAGAFAVIAVAAWLWILARGLQPLRDCRAHYGTATR